MGNGDDRGVSEATWYHAFQINVSYVYNCIILKKVQLRSQETLESVKYHQLFVMYSLVVCRVGNRAWIVSFDKHPNANQDNFVCNIQPSSWS